MAPSPDRVPGLLVDAQTIQGGFFGNRGIRRYALGISRALVARGAVRALLLNPGRPWHEEFPAEMQDLDELTWSTRRALRALDDGAATAYLMTSPFEQTTPPEAAMPSYVVESGMPIVAVLYDLIPEILDVYPPALMSMYWARRQLVKDADLLLTLSDHVRRDAMERLDVPADRVAMIGADVSGFFRPARPDERPRMILDEHAPRITRPFALSVTGWLANKNAGGLIEAWSHLPREVRSRFQLVLTCPLPPGGDSAWNDLAAKFGLERDDVVVTGQVDDRVVRALYQEAELLVAPSFEEGFGLPVLEAARCGCPAITSRTSSLPEVLDWEPSTFGPHDVDAMAESIERGLLDRAFRSDLRAVGTAAAGRHTWDRVAERTIEACAAIATPRRRRSPPLRVALVGRFSPAGNPSAMAADRVSASLPEGSRVDRFDTAPVSRAAGAEELPVRALGEIRDPWGYDAIVYIVDGDPPAEVVDLARSHPGVIWVIEAPADRVAAAELARGASAIVRGASVPALAVELGPFARSVPVVTVDDDTSVARAVTDAIGP